MKWDSNRDDELQPYQQPFLDVNNPISFITEIHWPPPLPIDKLAILNEIQLRMGIGIMSKKDALEELGEVFPDEKMRETFLELLNDAKDQGALDLIKAQIAQIVQEQTGQISPGGPAPMEPELNADGSTAPGPGVMSAGGAQVNTMLQARSPELDAIANSINNRAYGTTLSAGRPPNSDVDNSSESK